MFSSCVPNDQYDQWFYRREFEIGNREASRGVQEIWGAFPETYLVHFFHVDALTIPPLPHRK